LVLVMMVAALKHRHYPAEWRELLLYRREYWP
jgi:hypothetical protein